MAKTKKDDFDVEKCSARLKAVSDSDRLRLILQLREGRKNVSTLADAIGGNRQCFASPGCVARLMS